MNIKFQCGDLWLVTPPVRPPRRCASRPSAAAAGSTRPPRRGLLAARLPQASALLTTSGRLKIRQSRLPLLDPALGTPWGRGQAQSRRLSCYPARPSGLPLGRVAKPAPLPVKGKLDPHLGSQPENYPTAPLCPDTHTHTPARYWGEGNRKVRLCADRARELFLLYWEYWSEGRRGGQGVGQERVGRRTYRSIGILG